MFESSFGILPRQGENSKGDFLEIKSRHDRPDHDRMVYAASSKPAHGRWNAGRGCGQRLFAGRDSVRAGLLSCSGTCRPKPVSLLAFVGEAQRCLASQAKEQMVSAGAAAKWPLHPL